MSLHPDRSLPGPQPSEIPPTITATGSAMKKDAFERLLIATELLEKARQQFDKEETVCGIREIRETGGLVLNDFIQELEQEALPS